MRDFKNLLWKKVNSNTCIGEPRPVVPKAYEPDGKFYFCIAAKSNEKEVKLDILRSEHSKNGRIFEPVQRALTCGAVSLTSIATVDVILPYGYASGSIRVKYDGTEYLAADLIGSHETHILDQSIDLYNTPMKDGLWNYYVSYKEDNILLNRCAIGKNPTSSFADYLKITHRQKDNMIEFYVGKEKIAQICPQIYPWEPRYEGWTLDSYRLVVPFLTVRLAIDWFQYY